MNVISNGKEISLEEFVEKSMCKLYRIEGTICRAICTAPNTYILIDIETGNRFTDNTLTRKAGISDDDITYLAGTEKWERVSVQERLSSKILADSNLEGYERLIILQNRDVVDGLSNPTRLYELYRNANNSVETKVIYHWALRYLVKSEGMELKTYVGNLSAAQVMYNTIHGVSNNFFGKEDYIFDAWDGTNELAELAKLNIRNTLC